MTSTALTTRTTISERMNAYASASKAERTKTAYKSAWRNFETFCRVQGYTPMPAAPESVIDYLTELADMGQRANTIALKLAAVSFAHKAANAPDPTQAEAVRIVLAGIRRTIGTALTQKAPVLREELAAMVAQRPGADVRATRDRALILLGYAGAFRRSELVGLDVEDVQFTKTEMLVTLRKSKTDQDAAGLVKHIPQISAAAIDPVRAVREWLNVAQIASGPLFRACDRWGHIRAGRLNDRVVALVVKDMATRAGLEPRQFAGHSLRAGFVTSAILAGAQTWEIRENTGHKSDAMLQRYVRASGLGQTQAIRRAFGE